MDFHALHALYNFLLLLSFLLEQLKWRPMVGGKKECCVSHIPTQIETCSRSPLNQNGIVIYLLTSCCVIIPSAWVSLLTILSREFPYGGQFDEITVCTL